MSSIVICEGWRPSNVKTLLVSIGQQDGMSWYQAAKSPWKNCCSGRVFAMLGPGPFVSKTGYPLIGVTSTLFFMSLAGMAWCGDPTLALYAGVGLDRVRAPVVMLMVGSDSRSKSDAMGVGKLVVGGSDISLHLLASVTHMTKWSVSMAPPWEQLRKMKLADPQLGGRRECFVNVLSGFGNWIGRKMIASWILHVLMRVLT
jgi:hypothetical protein